MPTVKFAFHRQVPEGAWTIIEFSFNINVVEHNPWLVKFQLVNDSTIRLDETWGVGWIVGTGIRHANPKITGCRPALHGLANNIGMDGTFCLSGVIEGLENTVHFLPFQFAVQFRESQIVADQQAALYTVDFEEYEMIARRVVQQVAFHTEAFIVPIRDTSQRVNKVQTVMRFVSTAQRMSAAQNGP